MQGLIVTTELTTSFWTKVLRFIGLKKKREEFKLIMACNGFKKGDILTEAYGTKLLIIKVCT